MQATYYGHKRIGGSGVAVMSAKLPILFWKITISMVKCAYTKI